MTCISWLLRRKPSHREGGRGGGGGSCGWCQVTVGVTESGDSSIVIISVFDFQGYMLAVSYAVENVYRDGLIDDGKTTNRAFSMLLKRSIFDPSTPNFFHHCAILDGIRRSRNVFQTRRMSILRHKHKHTHTPHNSSTDAAALGRGY